MTLLTNEQVNEIIDIHNTTHTQFAHRLRVWNEKQTDVQVNADWSKAPDSVVSASIGLTWVNEDGLYIRGYHLTTLDRPKPVITHHPHPHAKLIMKYAEVSQYRSDPWVEFEWSNKSQCGWRKHTCSPIFKETNQYRYIGEIK